MVTQPKGNWHDKTLLTLCPWISYQGCPNQPWPNPTRNKRARSHWIVPWGADAMTLSRVEKIKRQRADSIVIYNLVLANETWEVGWTISRKDFTALKRNVRKQVFFWWKLLFCFPSFLTQPRVTNPLSLFPSFPHQHHHFPGPAKPYPNPRYCHLLFSILNCHTLQK